MFLIFESICCCSLYSNENFENFGNIYPTIQVVYTGFLVNIICYTSTLPVWMKDGVCISRNKTKSIYIQSVTLKHTGVYTCIGKTLNGQTFEASSELVVGGKLVNIIQVYE